MHSNERVKMDGLKRIYVYDNCCLITYFLGFFMNFPPTYRFSKFNNSSPYIPMHSNNQVRKVRQISFSNDHISSVTLVIEIGLYLLVTEIGLHLTGN